VAEAPVCNASPLIYLSRAGYLPLLQAAGLQVVVPDAVMEELRAKGTDDAVVKAVEAEGWLQLEPWPNIPRQIEAWDLGRGEAAVLAWALQHPGSEAILDDLIARRCAASLRLPCVGTLGIVVRAKRLGLIPAARPVVEELIRQRMYLSRKVLDEALGSLGE
jgi:predicted nucleic acid-binding protein